MNHPTTNGAPQPEFTEADFEHLAAAIDSVPEKSRELFLTKLCILLAASAPGVLADRIERAKRRLLG